MRIVIYIYRYYIVYTSLNKENWKFDELAIPTSALVERRSPMCVGGNSLRRPSNVWYAKSWWTCKRKAITSGMNDWTRRLQGVVLFFLGGSYCRNGICGRVNNSESQKWFGLGVMNDSWQYLVFTASLWLSGVQKRFQPSTLTFQVGEELGRKTPVFHCHQS